MNLKTTISDLSKLGKVLSSWLVSKFVALTNKIIYVNLTRRFKTAIINWRGKKVRNHLSEERKTLKLVCVGSGGEEEDFDWIEQIKSGAGFPRQGGLATVMLKADLTVEIDIMDVLRYGDQFLAVVNFCYNYYLGLKLTPSSPDGVIHVRSLFINILIQRHGLTPEGAKYLLDEMFDQSGNFHKRKKPSPVK